MQIVGLTDMTKRKKILLTITIIVLSVVACGLSYFFGYKNGTLRGFKDGILASRLGAMVPDMAQFSLTYQHMVAEMANADCEGVKKALNEYLDLLEKFKDVKDSFIVSPKSYLADKAFTHARLARVERHLGDNKEAENHMKLAIELCTQLKWKDCSEQNLISITKKTEQQNPISCLSGE